MARLDAIADGGIGQHREDAADTEHEKKDVKHREVSGEESPG